MTTAHIVEQARAIPIRIEHASRPKPARRFGSRLKAAGQIFNRGDLNHVRSKG
jgi:hypothetical protein